MDAGLGRPPHGLAGRLWLGRGGGRVPQHAALTAFENGGTCPLDLGGLATLSDYAYDTMAPRQWPIPATGTEGGRLFAVGGFPTSDG